MTLETLLTQLLTALSRIPAVKQAVTNAAGLAYAQPDCTDTASKRDSILDAQLSFLPKPVLCKWHAMSEFYDQEALVAEMKNASKAFAELWNYARGTREYWALEREVAAKYVRKAYATMTAAQTKNVGLLPTPRFNYGELMTR